MKKLRLSEVPKRKKPCPNKNTRSSFQGHPSIPLETPFAGPVFPVFSAPPPGGSASALWLLPRGQGANDCLFVGLVARESTREHRIPFWGVPIPPSPNPPKYLGVRIPRIFGESQSPEMLASPNPPKNCGESQSLGSPNPSKDLASPNPRNVGESKYPPKILTSPNPPKCWRVQIPPIPIPRNVGESKSPPKVPIPRNVGKSQSPQNVGEFQSEVQFPPKSVLASPNHPKCWGGRIPQKNWQVPITRNVGSPNPPKILASSNPPKCWGVQIPQKFWRVPIRRNVGESESRSFNTFPLTTGALIVVSFN